MKVQRRWVGESGAAAWRRRNPGQAKGRRD